MADEQEVFSRSRYYARRVDEPERVVVTAGLVLADEGHVIVREVWTGPEPDQVEGEDEKKPLTTTTVSVLDQDSYNELFTDSNDSEPESKKKTTKKAEVNR